MYMINLTNYMSISTSIRIWEYENISLSIILYSQWTSTFQNYYLTNYSQHIPFAHETLVRGTTPLWKINRGRLLETRAFWSLSAVAIRHVAHLGHEVASLKALRIVCRSVLAWKCLVHFVHWIGTASTALQ